MKVSWRKICSWCRWVKKNFFWGSFLYLIVRYFVPQDSVDPLEKLIQPATSTMPFKIVKPSPGKYILYNNFGPTSSRHYTSHSTNGMTMREALLRPNCFLRWLFIGSHDTRSLNLWYKIMQFRFLLHFYINYNK